MSESFWLLLAAALSFSGMAWLALAMEVHWGQVMHRPADQAQTTRRGLRGAGAAALGLSLLACLSADRPSMAALVWVAVVVGLPQPFIGLAVLVLLVAAVGVAVIVIRQQGPPRR